MKRNQLRRPPMARVIPDSRDGSKDFFIPLADAKRLYDEGKLTRDLTNGAWMQTDDKYLPELKRLAIP